MSYESFSTPVSLQLQTSCFPRICALSDTGVT
jgi:hypothetical protein